MHGSKSAVGVRHEQAFITQLLAPYTVIGARRRDLITVKTRFFALKAESIRLEVGILGQNQIVVAVDFSICLEHDLN